MTHSGPFSTKVEPFQSVTLNRFRVFPLNENKMVQNPKKIGSELELSKMSATGSMKAPRFHEPRMVLEPKFFSWKRDLSVGK